MIAGSPATSNTANVRIPDRCSSFCKILSSAICRRGDLIDCCHVRPLHAPATRSIVKLVYQTEFEEFSETHIEPNFGVRPSTPVPIIRFDDKGRRAG
jgi:hypothetical protein